MFYQKRREPFGGFTEREDSKVPRTDDMGASMHTADAMEASPAPSDARAWESGGSAVVESAPCCSDGSVFDGGSAWARPAWSATSQRAAAGPGASAGAGVGPSASSQGATCYVCRSTRGVPAQCCHCGRGVCDCCCRQCDACHDVFCTHCSIPNYDERLDRTFCLECEDQERQRRRTVGDRPSFSMASLTLGAHASAQRAL